MEDRLLRCYTRSLDHETIDKSEIGFFDHFVPSSATFRVPGTHLHSYSFDASKISPIRKATNWRYFLVVDLILHKTSPESDQKYRLSILTVKLCPILFAYLVPRTAANNSSLGIVSSGFIDATLVLAPTSTQSTPSSLMILR